MHRLLTDRRSAVGIFPVLVLVLCATLLALAPFAAALEVHHELAAADDDGHQHSDTDLCQWVQHHTGASLSLAPPAVATNETIQHLEWLPIAELFSAPLLCDGPSRAPPQL
ncbi:MAG: hypothetical protein E8D45_01905 [Nitrospira sp.]|nr:MAG: hypothetical protein E8D45_01905 [Nitrospira sp.]